MSGERESELLLPCVWQQQQQRTRGAAITQASTAESEGRRRTFLSRGDSGSQQITDERERRGDREYFAISLPGGLPLSLPLRLDWRIF